AELASNVRGGMGEHRRTALITTISGFLLLVLGASHAGGQAVYGSILGTVTDPSGAAVRSVRLTATSMERGNTAESVTNQTGNYEFGHLLPGHYVVSAVASGFRTSAITDLPVHVDQATRVDVKLHIGTVTEN